MIGAELKQFIKLNFPVLRKRSAFWFFNNEIRNNLAQTNQKTSSQDVKTADSRVFDQSATLKIDLPNSARKVNARKISRNKVQMLWRNMDPESKRKYFNMAEFDDIRYKEQKSLWVSEVGALLIKNDGSLTEIEKSAPTFEYLQREFLDSLEKIHKSYDRMIQAESTKTLYKDAIKRVDNSEPCLDTDELISAVPKQHRPLLTQPRRPPVPFVLFLNDNMARYKEMRRHHNLDESCMRLAGDEWAKLDPQTKNLYEERYSKLRDEYNKSMAEFRNKIESDESCRLVGEALKEKRAFKKSLRKRLRDASILPLSIRNAFNFFLMDNKDVKLKDLTEVWRNLPEDQKIRYIKMSDQDGIRYQNEIEAYREIRKGLSELLIKSKKLPR